MRKTVSVLVAAAFLTGCGSSEKAPSVAVDASGGDVAAFCDAAEELDKAALSPQGHPDDDQLDRMLAAAPPEIEQDAETLVGSAREFRDGNEEAASSDEIQAAGDRFDAYVQENC